MLLLLCYGVIVLGLSPGTVVLFTMLFFLEGGVQWPFLTFFFHIDFFFSPKLLRPKILNFITVIELFECSLLDE